MIWFYRLVALYLIIATPAYAATYHVSLTGTRTSGESTVDDWTDANCYGTFQAAIAQMSAADTLIIDDGIYTKPVENDHTYDITGVPSGTCTVSGNDYCATGDYTTVKARNPYEVFLVQNDVSQAEWPVNITGNHIHVDGIIVHMNDPSAGSAFNLSGDYNQVTRSISVRFGAAGSGATGFAASGNYNLFEDCAATGNTRYLFRTGGIDSFAHHNLFRRCVGRADYSEADDPKAVFNVYGHNDGTTGNVHDMSFQNCVGVDSNNLWPEGDTADRWNGDYYFIKGNDNISVYGSMSINSANTGGDSSAYFGGEDQSTLIMDNFVMFGGEQELKFPGKDGATLNHLTVVDTMRVNYMGTGEVLTNSAFFDLGEADWKSPTSADTNAYFGSYPAPIGTNQIIETSRPLYLFRVESNDSERAGAGTDGSDVGATILYRVGEPGTHHGEAGWNTETTTPLWPWPYEYYIDREFSRPNPATGGANLAPITNDTTRGFTDVAYDGTDHPLTKYLWELMGNSVGNTTAEIASFDFEAGYIPGAGPTCSDGIQNGDETGVDCGGSCSPCAGLSTPLRVGSQVLRTGSTPIRE